MTPPAGARRVVVTGIGVVTPAGHTLDATLAALDAGVRPFAPLTAFDTSSFEQPLGAEVKGFDPAPYFRVRKAMKLADRTTRFAVAAAAMALGDASWPGEGGREELGVVIGTSGSDPQVPAIARALAPDPEARSGEDIRLFGERILDGLNPLWLLVGLPNMASSHVGIQMEARGPNSTVMTDWVAGSQAVGEAFLWIQRGEATAVLAGGADTAHFPHAWATYCTAGLLARHAGDGPPPFVPGEGGAVLVLEDRDHALRRGAPIRAEVLSYGAAGGALDPGATVEANPVVRAMRAALASCPDDRPPVAMLGAGALALAPYRDVEARAIDALGIVPRDGAPRASFAARLGHAMGAASAIDLALLLAGHGPLASGAIVCNALGFRGQATTVVLTGADQAPSAHHR